MDKRLFFSSTHKNRVAIGEVLSKALPKKGSVLEIGSGSGEHGVIFQERFPELVWQTSDPELSHRNSISSWIEFNKLESKMPQPIDINVNNRPWNLMKVIQSTLKAVVCINMIHISPWESTINLFGGAGQHLKKNGLLILYGPFKKNGEHTSYSNSLFDDVLKEKNSTWGVRDLEEVKEIGLNNGFEAENIIQMPANNLSLIFRIN